MNTDSFAFSCHVCWRKKERGGGEEGGGEEREMER